MKIFRLLAIILALSVCATGVFAFWLYRELHKPVAHSLSNQYIEIPRGSTPGETVARLSSSGIIGRAWPLRLYIRFSGASTRLKAGEYRFPSPISPLGVLRKLEEGEQRLSRLTVVEGWTRWDIAAMLARIPELKLRSAEEALALFDDTSAIRDIDPEAKNLEGYLYPDTYSFPPDVTARQVVETMVKRFRQVWGELSAKHAPPPGLTPREVVTVASLVETEAKLKD